MELYRKVRLACRDGMSERAAARHFGVSRQSVRKMLQFSVPPGYRRTAPVRRPKLDEFTGLIEQWLEDDRRHGNHKLLIIDELGFVPLSKTGAELLFELVSQRYERAAVLITSNLPFDEWTETFGTERLTGALLDRLTHHVHILEMNGQSFRLNHSRARNKSSTT